MYFLTQFCTFCLRHCKKLKNINSNDIEGITIEEMFKLNIPEYGHLKSDIPKNICQNCVRNLNKNKFRQNFVENITSLNEYIKELIVKNGYCDYLSITLEEILQYKESRILKKNRKLESVFIKTEKLDDDLLEETTDELIIENEYNEFEDDKFRSEYVKIVPVDDIIKQNKKFSKNEKRIECSECDKTFQRSSDLRIHYRSHTGERPYECPICPKKFMKNSHLKQHKKTHTTQNQKTFPCAVCLRIFSRIVDLGRHKKTHDLVEILEKKPPPDSSKLRFHCIQCPRAYQYKYQLNSHYRTHSGEQPYQCPFCPKKFSLSRNLNNHKLSHTGERPHLCTICNKRFSKSTILKRHKRTHENLRLFPCAICDKSFTQRVHLNRHVMIHEGRKPFECQFCDYKCAEARILKRHLRKHT